MTLFTSLYTGVNGMNAQSKATAGISTNIANMTTVGYKKYDTSFSDLVVNNTKPARFANGGVLTHRIQRIDQPGALKQTSSSTELGINGDGFFVVKTQDDPSLQHLYTRNGTFSPDVNGVMRNAAGFILYGWPIDDATGTVISGTTLTSLVPVDVNDFDSVFRSTSAATLRINLDASEEELNPEVLGQAYPLSNFNADFSRSLTVYDGDGQARNLSFEFRKIVGPEATATTQASGLDALRSLTDPAFFAGINAGDTFTVTAGGASQQYIIGAAPGAGQVRVNTIGELTNQLNTTFGGGNALDASLNADGRLVIRAVDPTANIDFSEDVGTPISGGNSLDFAALSYAPSVDLNGGATYPDQADFPAFANTTSPNTYGWWEVTVLTPDPADPTNPALPPVAIRSGLMNFNSDGSLNAQADANGNVQLSLNNINFNNASTTDTLSIPVDVSAFTQFAGGYNVLVADQNGAEAGTLSNVDVTTDGTVVATFTNGEQLAIFQIPLASFVNPNGLKALTGTVFAQTQDAGDLLISTAGQDGTGIIQSATVEQSNVDLADEFANLIVSQRAFQANSRVVNTVDEMTQQLRTLKQ